MRTEIKTGTVCNNNCIFCLNENRSSYVRADEIKRQIDNLALMDVAEISFTGGEFSIRPEFFEIIKYARTRGFQVCVQTNGRTFSYYEFAKKTVIQGIKSFLVSLHTHNEKLNNELTGADRGYTQTVSGIKNLQKMGQQVIINTVVNKKNIEYLTQIIRHHCLLKPAIIQISWTRPMGRAKQNISLIPKYSENMHILNSCVKIALEKNVPLSIIGVPPCMLGNCKQHWGRPYTNTIIFTGKGKADAEKSFNKGRKQFVEVCAKCAVKDECGGIFKEYIEKYGSDEFKAIKK